MPAPRIRHRSAVSSNCGGGPENAFEQLCEVTGDRQHQDPPLLARQLCHHTAMSGGSRRSVGGRHARNGRLGTKISAAAQDPSDRLRHAGLRPASRYGRVQSRRRLSWFPHHAAACARGGRAAAIVGRALPDAASRFHLDIFYPEHWGASEGRSMPARRRRPRWCGNSRRNSR